MSYLFIYFFLIIKGLILTNVNNFNTLKKSENINEQLDSLIRFSNPYLNMYNNNATLITEKILGEKNKIYLSQNNTKDEQACINKTDELLQLIFDPAKSNKTINDYLPFFLYSGSGINQLGDYSTCIAQDDYNYVLTMITQFKLGLCFIKECKAEYLNKSKGKLVALINKQLNMNITENSVSFTNPKDDMIKYREDLDTGFYISITCLVLFASLSLIGTALIYFGKKNNKTYSLPQTQNDEDSQKDINKVKETSYVTLRGDDNEGKENLLKNENEETKLTFLQELFSPFDLIKNIKSIFTVRNENKLIEYMRVLDGVRFLSTCWVLWGHTFLLVMSSPTNVLNFVEIIKRGEYAILENAFVSVDVFFFLSGFLLYFTLVKYTKNLNGICDRIKFFFISLFQRWIRLFPLFFIASVFLLYVLAPFNNGALSSSFMGICDGCKKYWWANMLYVQDLVEGALRCVGHGWYLGDDMLFFIATLIVILALLNKTLYQNIVILALFIYSNVWQIIQCNYYGYSPSILKQFTTPTYFNDFYIYPIARINPYLMGIWYCQLLFETDLYQENANKNNKNINENSEDLGIIRRFNRYLQKNNWLCFLIFIFSLAEINFSLFSVLLTVRYDTPQSFDTFFLVFSKVIFINGLGNILHLTFLGKLGFIRSFLSMEVFSILGKLTYAIYIFHFYIIMTFAINSDSSFRIDFLLTSFIAMGIMAITIVVALVMSVLFESPVINMLKTTKSKKIKQG